MSVLYVTNRISSTIIQQRNELIYNLISNQFMQGNRSRNTNLVVYRARVNEICNAHATEGALCHKVDFVLPCR